MPKVNCVVVVCSSSTYGINKWKKEPCLEHGDKNLIKGQRPNCERPCSLYCLPAEMTKGRQRERRERERCMDSGSQMRKFKQNKMDPKKQ